MDLQKYQALTIKKIHLHFRLRISERCFLLLSDDLRVILIKIADRLHNMRTLDSMPEHKKMKVAGETIFLYAPLANRLGLYAIKSELGGSEF